MFVRSARRRGVSLIEVLVVVLILGVLVCVALPFYLRSVSDSEEFGCKTNMSSIASAEQAQKVRSVGPYWAGDVDAAAAATDGPLRDLHNAVPQCPGDVASGYMILSNGSGGFIIRCKNSKHHFQWHNGEWETY